MTPRNQILAVAENYFPKQCWHFFESLPIPVSYSEDTNETWLVELPDWARDIGVGVKASLLVPASCITQETNQDWNSIDWWRAAFELITCANERNFETKHGVVHSYAYKLPKSMAVQWERAWANRIFLFLRRWVSREYNRTEAELLGENPRGTVHLTHDVDYVTKTLALRLKQTAFVNYNIVKYLLSGNLRAAFEMLPRLLRFGLGFGNYWQFPVIRRLEAEYGAMSSWNFYGGIGGFKRSASELLLDPSYRVENYNLAQQIKLLQQEGNRIGLHQGFHSWCQSDRMKIEKKRLEEALGDHVNSCRQHWLRFSFKDTWKAQEAAGFNLDTTLGFNDRSGFRNSAALCMPAWIESENRFSDLLKTLPMVLMDSHLFDYAQLDAAARKRLIDYYLDEIAFVGGEVTVIWHQRVFHADYGWGSEYEYLLNGINSRNLAA